MKEIIISSNEANQRLDKLLAKQLKEAPKSFLYKMLRKKNITLNGKKAQGNEILKNGDSVKIFLSDDTYAKFAGSPAVYTNVKTDSSKLDILYEDDHILLLNKPAGMLSQKADPKDVSLVEYLISYLLEKGSLTEDMLQTFHPSICNRLDRNTSGIVIAGKSLAGLQEMSRIIKERTVKKYYRCIVKGHMQDTQYLKGYLLKDEKSNRVTVYDHPVPEAKPIETEYHVITASDSVTLLEIHLITGRSHQIRAHLASIGHPIIGDPKYGDNRENQSYHRKYQVTHQLLHAYRIEFPVFEGVFSYLSNEIFTAPIPPIYQKVLKD